MSVPFLPCVLGFAVTEYATVPAPFPVPPVVTAIHAPLDVAVQVHPADTETVTDPVPPLASNVWLSGEIVAVQEGVGSVGDLLPHAAMTAERLPMKTRTAKALTRMRHLVSLHRAIEAPARVRRNTLRIAGFRTDDGENSSSTEGFRKSRARAAAMSVERGEAFNHVTRMCESRSDAASHGESG